MTGQSYAAPSTSSGEAAVNPGRGETQLLASGSLGTAMRMRAVRGQSTSSTDHVSIWP